MKNTRPSKFKNVIGDRVRRAREALKPTVSQDDLSGRLARLRVQITQSGISKVESRQRSVLDYEAEAFAKALGVTVAWLYGETAESGNKRVR